LIVLLGAIYGTWLLAFWPGILGEDSLAIVLEVESQGRFESGKPNFWYFFVKLFYEPLRLVERPIMVQMGFCVLVFARILTWCWHRGLRKAFFFLLLFIAVAPHMIYFMGLLNADSLFSVATTGLLFEIWLISRTKKINAVSFAMVAITLPFAIFARTNGIVSLIPLIVVTYALSWPERLKLLGITVFWCGLMLIAGQAHTTRKHDTLFPLAAFETANFLQPRPMGLKAPLAQVSERTVQILSTYAPIQKTIENYDRDYWDPLVYKAGGPDLLRLTPQERSDLVHEFFAHNLWQNIPSFASSRVNVFLVALLAQGGFATVEDSAGVIARSKSQSEFRAFHLSGLEKTLKGIFDFSFSYRWLLWTPVLGIFLLFYTTRLAWKNRDTAVLAITGTMIMQLGGIFVFSIASEYRYLLPFFILPMALLPILATSKLSALDAS